MSKKRQTVTSSTLRVLYAHSGNKCAFPECIQPVFEDNGLYTGICCHIEAYSPKGPRYNTATSIEEKNSDSNLILLCSRHHTIIDSDVELYSVAKLKALKNNHEKQYKEEERNLNNLMLIQINRQMDSFYDKLSYIDKQNEIDQKITIDYNIDIETNISLLEEKLNDLFSIHTLLGESDSSINTDEFLTKIKVDKALVDAIPYYENPFELRHWEIHHLAIPNISSKITLYFELLKIKLFELLLEKDTGNTEIQKKLTEQRYRYEELYSNIYYAD